MKLLMCNLKTNKTLDEMIEYLNNISLLQDKDNLIIFPSNLYLGTVKDYDLTFGSQDVSLYCDSSSTGEITAKQVRSTGAKYTIIGHSERRDKFQEDEYLLSKKIKNALEANLNIIYCIGETLEEKQRHKTYHILEKQIAKIFNSLTMDEMQKITIAYEPVWAIGNGNPAKVNEIEEINDFIKKIVLDYYAINIKVLYGGSVNSDNISSYANAKNIDGFLVGKASLNPLEVANMLEKINL